MRALSFVFAFLLAPTSEGADYTFTGYARSIDTGTLLYVETHAVSAAETANERRVVLYSPDLERPPFARKLLEYDEDRSRPGFWLEDRRSGFAEGFAQLPSGSVVSARAGAAANLRTRTVAGDSVLIVDAGFDEFVRTRWTALARGESLLAPFLVPSRLGAVNFRVRRVSATRIDGADASVIRLSLAGPLGWILSDIDVTYRNSDRRLLRYRGLTNIRDAGGELLEAQIDFPDAARSDAPVDIDALRAIPLVSPGR
jgi:hypothetical protein